MVRLSLVLVIVAVFGYASAIDCWGSTCTADQYCEVKLNQNSGVCYTHHGHGHHEDHQMCIGAHHPGDHCFCKDQACVDSMMAEMASRSTAASGAPGDTTVVVAATTTAPPATII